MKTIIIDLDGTAVDSPEQKVVSDRLHDATQGLIETGYTICAATGRGWSFAEPVVSSLELKSLGIFSGGTVIADPTGETAWQSDIDTNDLQAVYEIAQAHKESAGFLWGDFSEPEYIEKGGWSLDDFDPSVSTNFFQYAFLPQEMAAGVMEQLGQLSGAVATLVVAQKPGFNDIHITNREATKEHAIAVLLKMLDVSVEDTIGIGDGHNDIHLFRGVGYKIAMGNAVDELKAEADEVIGSIKDDGLAEYFERLLEEGDDRG